MRAVLVETVAMSSKHRSLSSFCRTCKCGLQVKGAHGGPRDIHENNAWHDDVMDTITSWHDDIMTMIHPRTRHATHDHHHKIMSIKLDSNQVVLVSFNKWYSSDAQDTKQKA